jgi:hypothetical protein
MTISGKILNSLNGQPLSGAKISVYRKNGTSTSLGKTDVKGNYNVTVNDSIQCLLIEKDNFTPTLVAPGELQAAGGINVAPANVVTGAGAQPTNMPSVPAAGAASSNPVAQTLATIPAPVWIAGGLTLAAMSVGAKKKIGDINYTPFILIGALGIGAYFLYEAIFGGPPSGGSQNNLAQAQQTAAAQAAALAASQATTPGTLNSAQASSIANDIYAQLQTYSSLTGGITDAAAQQILFDMNQVQNITDYYAVANAFGSKNINCNLFGSACTAMDLPTAIKFGLNAANLQILNNTFAQYGINFVF